MNAMAGMKFFVPPTSRSRHCGLCGKAESDWPKSFKDPSAVTDRISQSPFWAPAILEKRNDAHAPRPHYACGHLCANDKRHKCCQCVGTTAPCSACGPRELHEKTGQYSGPAAAAAVALALHHLVGFDGTRLDLNSAQFSTREARLNGNINPNLFHQTGKDGCRGIITSGQMNKGAVGIAAGGIYFAAAADDTMHKAHSHGFLFTLSVRLGNVEHWAPTKVDYGVTFEKLATKGVDSIHIPRPGGDEFIVYHSDQVELRNVQKVLLPAYYHTVPNGSMFPYPTKCMLVGPAFSCKDLRKNLPALEAFIAGDTQGAQALLAGGSHAAGSAQAGLPLWQMFAVPK